MISLGSCTMKLNATSEMIPVTWPEFADMHPFAPLDQAQGYLEMIDGLTELAEDDHRLRRHLHAAELRRAGRIRRSRRHRRYHASRGEGTPQHLPDPEVGARHQPGHGADVRHEVVVVDCDDNGNVDVADLKAKAEQHAANLACLMITYPSTHGVFEEAVKDICAIVHASTAARSTWTAPTSTRRSA
jgi:glycine dehydrogenase